MNSTVISIVPVEIREFKPGIYPGHFNINACANPEKPEILSVKPSMQMFIVSGQKNPIPVETPSYVIAGSIVKDFITGQLALGDGGTPGIAFLDREVTQEQFLKDHKKVHEEMKRVQKTWFINLVKMADNDWNRYHNHKVVAEVAKVAARYLGLTTKEWLLDEFNEENFIKCVACRQRITAEAVVCHYCRAIQDATLATVKGIKFAAA